MAVESFYAKRRYAMLCKENVAMDRMRRRISKPMGDTNVLIVNMVFKALCRKAVAA